MSEMGYGMMFGSDVQKDFFLKRIKGRGYVDVGTSVISEFYTPLVPKGYDFLEEIKSYPTADSPRRRRASGSRRCGLILLAGVAIATPALNPPVSNRGVQIDGNSQKNIRKSLWLQGIYKISAYVKWALKVDIRLFIWRDFLLNEQTWLQHLKEKRLAYGLSQNRLAVATGITRQYLSDIETGKVKPSEDLQQSFGKLWNASIPTLP